MIHASILSGGSGTDVTLRDGSRVQIRPVLPRDRGAMRAFLGALSHESIGFRFFGAVDLDWASRESVDMEGANWYGLIATAGREQAIVAQGEYVCEDAHSAEVAFVVADAFHQLGLATVLLGRLAGYAAAHGISMFTAVVLPYNNHMIDVFRESGFRVHLHMIDGEVRVKLATSPAPLIEVGPWPSGGWAVKIRDHPGLVSRHDTEEEAQNRAAAYRRGLAGERGRTSQVRPG